MTRSTPKSPFAGTRLSEQTPKPESGLDQRLFERSPVAPPNAPSSEPQVDPPTVPIPSPTSTAPDRPTVRDAAYPRHRAIKPSSSTPATSPSDRQAGAPGNASAMLGVERDALVEIVRRAVKEFGHEHGTHRFTERERLEVDTLVYDYRRTGIRTTGNEVLRIALNHLLEDHRILGRSSILARVLDKLNS